MADITYDALGRIVADIGSVTSVVVDPDNLVVTGGTDGNDLGYPDIIIDQRRGYGTSDLNTVAEVVTFWTEFLARKEPPLEIHDAADPVVPYINASRWVAGCACGGGMLAWDQNPYCCCLECGARYGVRWQPPALRSAVIRELAGRPVENRNWDPRRLDGDGLMVESVEFLRRENVLMGIV